MKAFIVIGWWSYEGYDRPIAVYSSRELADAAVKTAYSGYNGVDVIECEIDREIPPD